MTLTAEELKQMRERVEAATDGLVPYSAPHGGAPPEPCPYAVVSNGTGRETARVWEEADARFYAAARQDMPRLLDAVEAMMRALQPFAKLADHYDKRYGNRPHMPEHDIMQISSGGLPDAGFTVGDLRAARDALPSDLKPPA